MFIIYTTYYNKVFSIFLLLFFLKTPIIYNIQDLKPKNEKDTSQDVHIITLYNDSSTDCKQSEQIQVEVILLESTPVHFL